MTLNKEAHRAALLELISKTAFSGAVAREVVELIEAIETAKIEDAPQPTSD
jgi:hypothetical protein